MPEQGHYAANERHLYEPDPCPDCGSRNVTVKWVPVQGMNKSDEYIPGTHSCQDCRNLR